MKTDSKIRRIFKAIYDQFKCAFTQCTEAKYKHLIYAELESRYETPSDPVSEKEIEEISKSLEKNERRGTSKET